MRPENQVVKEQPSPPVSQRKRGRPRKAARPVSPLLAETAELKPGEVEQSNCIARLQHAKIRLANQSCPHCGYPGEWTGLKTERPEPIRHVVGERMEAARALPLALRHIEAMLKATAGKNANEIPTDEFCLVCDGNHEGGSACPCACHAARTFLRSQQGAYL